MWRSRPKDESSKPHLEWVRARVMERAQEMARVRVLVRARESLHTTTYNRLNACMHACMPLGHQKEVVVQT